MTDLALPGHIFLAAKPVAQPIIQSGVNYMSFLIDAIVAVVSAGIGAGLAWYMRGRGMTGVQIDIDNAKKEIDALKTKIGG